MVVKQTPFELVVASYHRARETGQLFDTFYNLFLAKAPDVRPMLARTDFPHQKLMLRESILEMLLFAQTGAGREEIEKLGERHRQLNVKARHYEVWLDALCEALNKHDPQFTTELADKWRSTMRKGIELMTGKLTP